MTEYETRRPRLDVGRELQKKCRLIIGLAALSVAVGCTTSPSSEKGQPASTEQSSTPFSEPNYGNQDLPGCRYDLDGDPETLSPGEAFIAAAEGAWVAPDGSQAYIAPILVKNLFPGETNESASLKPYHVNGGPFYVAGAAEVASAGIHRDRMSISPPFQGW